LILAEFNLLIEESQRNECNFLSTPTVNYKKFDAGRSFYNLSGKPKKQKTKNKFSIVDRTDVSYTFFNAWNLTRTSLNISPSVKKTVLHAFLLTFILNSFMARMCSFSTVDKKKNKDLYSL
jgi:hypothetical protein